jgi:cardiolipin synthase
MRGAAGADIPAAESTASEAGSAAVLFVPRDDKASPDGIEAIYRQAIRSARARVCIANAYFFPGYRLFRDLCQAARRGVHPEDRQTS